LHRRCKAAATLFGDGRRMTQTSTTTATDRLLLAVTNTGTSVEDVYAADAVFDATVPGWRFTVRTASAIGYQYAEWFRAEATFEELERHVTPTGEVVEYTIAWEEDGVPHAAHHVHVLTIDADTDLVAADHMWCGGRWPAPVLAQMEAARR
jgi:hypothetical protein